MRFRQLNGGSISVLVVAAIALLVASLYVPLRFVVPDGSVTHEDYLQLPEAWRGSNTEEDWIRSTQEHTVRMKRHFSPDVQYATIRRAVTHYYNSIPIERVLAKDVFLIEIAGISVFLIIGLLMTRNKAPTT